MRETLLWLLAVAVLAVPAVPACDGGDGDGDADADTDADTDLDADVVADARLDGDPDSTGGIECGDAAVMAIYETCTAASDEASCGEAGGEWTFIDVIGEERCLCSTGQDACPCTRASQCILACISPTDHANLDCGGVRDGSCASQSVQRGCFCFFDDDGEPSGACSG